RFSPETRGLLLHFEKLLIRRQSPGPGTGVGHASHADLAAVGIVEYAEEPLVRRLDRFVGAACDGLPPGDTGDCAAVSTTNPAAYAGWSAKTTVGTKKTIRHNVNVRRYALDLTSARSGENLAG